VTLPTSGSISMSQVAAELGISATGLSLNDSRVRSLAGKPSGAISMSDLRGKSASALTSFSAQPTNISTATGTRSATATFNTDGSIALTNSSAGGSTSGGNWYAPNVSSIGSSYWIKVVVNGSPGSTSLTGTFGSWLHLSAAQAFTFQNTSATVEGTGSANVYFSTAGSDASIVETVTNGIVWDAGHTV
jgi:hypothetical protein